MQETQQTVGGNRPIYLHESLLPIIASLDEDHDDNQTEQAQDLIKAVILVVAIEDRNHHRPIAEARQRERRLLADVQPHRIVVSPMDVRPMILVHVIPD